jgi:hypothetical protein
MPPPHTIVATPERISALADTLLARIRESIKEIGAINMQARVLAFNAQIEAARAAEHGRSFAIVGKEMASFSQLTQQVAIKLEQESESLVLELAEISRQLATNVRGTRLCDLALTNIDLIDRNLYERSCDVRWWATDAAMVTALTQKSDQSARHASERMSVILKAYTVYFDIVLADLDGRIVANGRSAEFPSRGTSHRDADWFRSALATRSGDEFGFESVHVSSLVGGKRALVYSCKVCQDGSAQAKPIGVLGIVFNWDGLAQKIVHETPIEPDRKSVSRVCIVDDNGRVLADSHDKILQAPIEFTERAQLFAGKKSHLTTQIAGVPTLVAHGQSPGFETYRTGWHSLVMEQHSGEKTG